MKTLSGALLAHFQGEYQTKAVLWLVKLNYRRIDISGVAGSTISTVQAHTMEVDDYVAVSNTTGAIADDPTGTWNFLKVTSVPTATSIVVEGTVSGYGGGGTLHQVFGFTSHVEDIERDGLLYKADTAFTPTASQQTSTLAVPTIEMEGIMIPELSTALGFKESDLVAGKLDFAEVRTQVVNYEDLTMGSMWLNRGYVGKVTIENDQYVTELRGLSQIAAQQILEVYSPGCRYNLGSTRCTVDLNSYLTSGTVGTVVTERLEITGPAGADDYLKHGAITFTTGACSGLSMEIKAHTGGVVTLWQPMPFVIAPGDGFEVTPGCDKKFETCRDKYANLINFGGFPHLPGEDELAQVLVPKVPEYSVTSG